jgi:hypothetical protein
MKHFFILTAFFFLFAVNHLHAQKMKMMIMNGDTVYIMEPSAGDKLYQAGDIKGAVAAYRKQLKKSPQDSLFLAHNFACALTKNNEPDSAFKYLYMDLRHDSTPFVLTDPDLLPLRHSKQWPDFEQRTLNAIKAKYPQVKDFPLAAKLWELLARDQAYYYEIDIAEKKLGMNSPVALALWEAKHALNDKNVKELDSIINIKGWPKKTEVGSLAASAAFLIIQHSTFELQQKYLPTIKTLCEQGEASWQSYALMYDRVQIGQGKAQLYGSQVNYNAQTKKYELFPIEDEIDVDKRRAEMGMGKLADYVSQWGIKYVPLK